MKEWIIRYIIAGAFMVFGWVLRVLVESLNKRGDYIKTEYKGGEVDE